jgi:hypothetical protein
MRPDLVVLPTEVLKHGLLLSQVRRGRARVLGFEDVMYSLVLSVLPRLPISINLGRTPSLIHQTESSESRPSAVDVKERRYQIGEKGEEERRKRIECKASAKAREFEKWCGQNKGDNSTPHVLKNRPPIVPLKTEV